MKQAMDSGGYNRHCDVSK